MTDKQRIRHEFLSELIDFLLKKHQEVFQTFLMLQIEASAPNAHEAARVAAYKEGYADGLWNAIDMLQKMQIIPLLPDDWKGKTDDKNQT